MSSIDNVPPDTGTLPGTKSSPLRWRVLNEDEWFILKEVRLTALKESPRSFLSKYEKEITFTEKHWRAEFARGEWIMAGEEGKPPDAMVGVVSGYDIPSTDRYLEYLWVSPRARRSRLATDLIRAVLLRFKALGIDTVWLWILDGNESARELYNKCGFTTTGLRHRPKVDRSVWEERMNRRLSARA
jgi:ribosomal protein S18 acetylase RimI-like enzyme